MRPSRTAPFAGLVPRISSSAFSQENPLRVGDPNRLLKERDRLHHLVGARARLHGLEVREAVKGGVQAVGDLPHGE